MMKALPFPARLAARCLCLFAMALAASAPVLADRLHFTDGESITGLLVGIDGGRVIWRSEILGDLSVEQRHVQLIESGDRFDLETSGRELSNCWMFVQGERQHLHCDQGISTLGDWKLVVAAGETLTEPPPLLTQQGSVRLAAEDSSGNNDITKFNLDGRTELRLVESRHTIALRYQEESADGANTRNMWRGSYQYDQFFTRQWFATGNAFYEEDEFREIDRRVSAGLGMGYQFLDTSYLNLLAKTTLNYVEERFTNGVERRTPAFLWNLDFGWRLNDNGMEFFHRHALLQAIDDGDDWEVNTTTGLRYPISGQFSSTLQFEFDYDNLPAEDIVEKKDQKWSIGVNYDW